MIRKLVGFTLAFFLAMAPDDLSASDLPDFEGVYIQTHTGDLIEVPQRRIRDTVAVGASTRAGGRERFNNSFGWLHLRGITQAEYNRLPHLPVLPAGSSSAARDVTIIVNFRGNPRVTRINQFVPVGEFAARIDRSPPQGPGILANLADAPSPSAGQIQYGSPRVEYIDNNWGYDAGEIFRTRVLGEHTTQYVFRDPGRHLAAVLGRRRGTGDPYGNHAHDMPIAGFYIQLSDGRTFPFKSYPQSLEYDTDR